MNTKLLFNQAEMNVQSGFKAIFGMVFILVALFVISNIRDDSKYEVNISIVYQHDRRFNYTLYYYDRYIWDATPEIAISTVLRELVARSRLHNFYPKTITLIRTELSSCCRTIERAKSKSDSITISDQSIHISEDQSLKDIIFNPLG